MQAFLYYRRVGEEGQDNLSVSKTQPVYIGSKRNMVISEQRQVALIDVDDLIVVETPDALLICRRGSGQKVKQVFSALEEKNQDTT